MPTHWSRLACLAIAAGALTAVSCEAPSTPTAVLELAASRSSKAAKSTLEKDLRRLLVHGSGGRGMAFYMLPRSHQLGRIPQDPQNRLTRARIELGRYLYHETALGVNNLQDEGWESYSCASCHFAQAGFMANLPQGIGEGGQGFGSGGDGRTTWSDYYADDEADVQPIRTPTTLNSAFQELMLWNGQFGGVGDNLGTEDRWTPGTPLASNHLGMMGLETQAHAGLGVHRMADIEQSRLARIPEYAEHFRKAFPGDRSPINRLNAALAIAAFERSILANRAPFQDWLRGDASALTDQQKRGAILFFGEAGCSSCHTGPALNSMTFHALGMADLDASVDPGRVNLAKWGGQIPDATARGRGGFTGNPADDFKFKTPQLYNLRSSPFLGHGASFGSVREVIEYMNAAVPQKAVLNLSEQFVPLGLAPDEVSSLVAFVEEALYDADLMRYVPERLPSGNCAPVNDPYSQHDLGCTPLGSW